MHRDDEDGQAGVDAAIYAETLELDEEMTEITARLWLDGDET